MLGLITPSSKNYGVIEGYLYEGVLVKLRNANEIFYVKGLQGEDNSYIILPRYVPCSHGDKIMLDGSRYLTLKTFKDQMKYVLSTNLKKYLRYSRIYGQVLPLVPVQDIEQIYDPVKRAQDIKLKPKTYIENIAAELLDLICTCVSKNNVGITGSLLAGFVEGVNDIDILILDIEEGRALMEYIQSLKNMRPLSFRINEKLMHKIYLHHSKTLHIDYSSFCRLWRRRILEGFYKGVPYFIRILAMRKRKPVFNMLRTRKIGTLNLILKIKLPASIFAYTTPCIHAANGSFRKELTLVSDRGIFTDTLVIVRNLYVSKAYVEYAIFKIEEDVYSGVILYLGPECSVSPITFL